MFITKNKAFSSVQALCFSLDFHNLFIVSVLYELMRECLGYIILHTIYQLPMQV